MHLQGCDLNVDIVSLTFIVFDLGFIGIAVSGILKMVSDGLKLAWCCEDIRYGLTFRSVAGD